MPVTEDSESEKEEEYYSIQKISNCTYMLVRFRTNIAKKTVYGNVKLGHAVSLGFMVLGNSSLCG